MIFAQLILFWAGVIKLIEFYGNGNFLLVVIDAVVLITSLMVMLEVASVISSFKKGTATERQPVA